MNHSDDIAELAKALSAFQGAMKPIPRSRTVEILTTSGGKFHYSYAPLEDIVDAIRDELAKNGLAISQTLGFEGEWDTLVTTLLHTSGQWFAGAQRLNPTSTPQAQGSEITYARRYGAAAILSLVTDDDDDAALAEEGSASHGETSDTSSHWCPIHQTVFFKKGRMRNYAHPIGDTGEWCNEPDHTEPPPSPARTALAPARGQAVDSDGGPPITTAQRQAIQRLESELGLKYESLKGWTAKQGSDYFGQLQRKKQNPEAALAPVSRADAQGGLEGIAVDAALDAIDAAQTRDELSQALDQAREDGVASHPIVAETFRARRIAIGWAEEN